jgi:hypothetical protein
VLADHDAVLRALRLPLESEVDIEPAGHGVERWAMCPPGAEPRVVVLRVHPDPELAANHAAVVEALSRSGFRHMPEPLAVVGHVLVEAPVAGVTALSLVPPEGSAEAAVAALASLHALDIQEGLRWGRAPVAILGDQPLPLHRLGFAAAERSAAEPALAAAARAVLDSPWGFTHGDAIAGHVLLAPGKAWLVSFHAAGFGPQLFDLSAFLLTSGLDATARRALAGQYASLRALDVPITTDLVDLAGILWGISELLVLPRRSIELLGDDSASAALNTAAGRIERGIREPAGRHAAAREIRAALWPS